MSVLMAGGGVRGGQVIGASDGQGAYPADRPVACEDLIATVYHAFGISPDDTVEAVGGQQSNTSRHLQALFDARMVGRRRAGSSVLYWISDPDVFRLCEIVCHSAEQEAIRSLAELKGR